MRVLLIFLLFALPACAEPLDDFIQQAMRDFNVPGASVAVVKADQVIYLKGFGVLREGSPEKVDPDTIFALASVTKTFTAAMLGTLVDEGTLGWDRPLHLVLQDGYAGDHVTLRDLLSHRAGFPAFQGDIFDKLGYSREEVVRRMQFQPMEGFRDQARYSNLGYFLAGMAAGGRWEDQVTTRILQPLGLTRTGFYSGPLKLSDNVAFPHGADGPAPQFDEQTVLAPAGEMSSTARDLARFLRMQLNHGELILKPETVEAMHTPVMATEPEFSEGAPISKQSGFAFTLGWADWHYNGCEIVEKSGARFGVRTLVTLIPQKNMGIVVLSNRNLTFFPESVRAYLLEQYLGKVTPDPQAGLRVGQKRITEMFAGLNQPLAQATGPTTLPLERYCGSYESALYGTLKVVKAGATLRWKLGPAGFGAALVPAGYNSFWLTYPQGLMNIPEEVIFVMNAQGQPQELITESYGRFGHASTRK